MNYVLSGRLALGTTKHIAVGKKTKQIQLYTPEERVRRDASVWTLVQGILAPIQFLIFLISLGLVMRTLVSQEGYEIATYSIVFKTLILYTIMITGAIWEKVVFGKYLFAKAFFWEDVFSMLVLALHTAYLVALYYSWLTQQQLLILALAAYAAYVINAVQFVLKLRAARLQAAQKNHSQNQQMSQNIDTLGNKNTPYCPQGKSLSANLEAST